MGLIWVALGGVAALVVVWVALVAFTGLSVPAPPHAAPRPARSRAEALVRLDELSALDDESIAEACRTRLIEPDGDAKATIVIWHGFTNCPAQFAKVADIIAARGYRILLARLPRHGVADTLNHGLRDLTTRELVQHADACIDIAAGLGPRVWVVGLSAGGVVAGWVAATRIEVERVVLSAPFVAPKAIPYPVVRLLIRFKSLVPGIFFWWDPRKKADLGESPYVYPGFPLPGMVPFIHLGEALYDRHVDVVNTPRRVALTSNPGDFAIRRDVARTFTHRVFDGHAGSVLEVTLDGGLGWWHDFVDPWGPHHGPAEQVAEIFCAALGVAVDPSAGGAIVDPLPPSDPPIDTGSVNP